MERESMEGRNPLPAAWMRQADQGWLLSGAQAKHRAAGGTAILSSARVRAGASAMAAIRTKPRSAVQRMSPNESAASHRSNGSASHMRRRQVQKHKSRRRIMQAVPLTRDSAIGARHRTRA